MGSLVGNAAALLLSCMLALIFGVPSVLGYDLRERDALCNADGCFVVFFQRKTFLESWRSCKEKGGDLATIKRREDAASIASLFSTLDLRFSRTKVQVWIGLQRQPRQCTTSRPLRGFSWTTGDQDTEYTNWIKEDSPSMCMVPRCVVMGYSLQERSDNLKWQDGSCSIPVDGFLCHYGSNGMCPALWSEGGGNVLYSTPFNLQSTLLTYVPFGSVAAMPCPTGIKEEQSVLCILKEDGSVGWSKDPPLCSDPLGSHSWCDQDNGGCEHFCKPAGAGFSCECAEGYQLGDDRQSCELADFCEGAPCESECVRLSDGYRCACPDGYMLAPDERGCLDVDECLQSPCEHICVNNPGTFVCQCRDGYRMDDEGGCEDLDECMGDPCEHACENTPGSHFCYCHLGYNRIPEDPSRCQDTDECQIPGICEQMCANYEGGFDCYCEEGFELMSDHYSCWKRREGVDPSAITSPFHWVTHRPGPVWDPADYDWNPQQDHTDWPPEVEQSLDWLTDPSHILNSDVIWVTSAPQENLPTRLSVDSSTQESEKEGDKPNWGQGSQPESEVFPNSIHTTPPPTSGSNTPPDWYEDEETTTTLPFLSTSTISEGALNWWTRLTSHKPEDSGSDYNTQTDFIYSNERDEDQPPSPSYLFPEDLGEEEGDFVEITHFQYPTVLAVVTPSAPSFSEGGDIVDSKVEDSGQTQSSTWLLVGVLVPVCIFLFVMLALGVFYCTHCSQSRSKSVSDCYHWISGAHNTHGAPNLSAGVKADV